MGQLDAFDFQNEFTAKQTAALIGGIDPGPTGSTGEIFMFHKVEPIFKRMARDYHEAWGYWHARSDGNFQFNESAKLPNDAIQSVEMVRHQNNIGEHGISENYAEYFDRWIGHGTSQDGEFSAFEKQTFSRTEISRWLSAIGLKSVYPFDLSQPQAIETPSGRWPWGNHHTELLGHLDAAAREFWGKYDPANVKATAPKNETVINWLVTERNVSETVATSMATMLRPDGLKTGPRKGK